MDGANHVYTLNGTQIVSEAWGNYLLIYLYDESGSPIGMQYRTKSYAANVFDTFYFEKNLQGDIVAIYNASGEKIGSYIYDAWGICTVTVESTNTTLENKIVRILNPFRYRGYYYDTESGWYYLQSRYYDPQVGRFINADGIVGANGGITGYNMFAYCNNNPVMYFDPSGFMAGYGLSSKVCQRELLGTGGGAGIGGAVVAVGVVGSFLLLEAAVSGLEALGQGVIDFVDTIAVPGVIAIPYEVDAYYDTHQDVVVAEATEDIAEEEELDPNPIFPFDPYSFHPSGLILDEYPGSSNGKILKWRGPLSGNVYFEWNEDFKYGPHYHIVLYVFGKEVHWGHYKAGDTIPEPWAKIFFYS